MQWWYFDIFFPNGSILIIAFVPHKWWKDAITSNIEDCLLAVSFLNRNGKIFQFEESYNQSELKYDTNKIEIQNRFKIDFNKDNEEYKIYLNVKRVKGEILVRPKCKPFSGLPFGIISGIERILMFQTPWSSSDFRYISQIPKGLSSGKFIFDGEVSQEEGCVYHEQGWFNDLPQKLFKGWIWFHFHHPEWNLFGAPQGYLPTGYLFIQSKDRVLIGGINLFKLPYRMINKQYMPQYHPKMIIGGDIFFKANGLEFTLSTISDEVKPLIVFKSVESKQFYSTGITSARLCITQNKKTEEVEGKMILESCWLEN